MSPPIPRVPKPDSPAVAKILKTIGTDTAPVSLKIEAVADGDPTDCFANVSRVIEQRGGSAAYGWKIWETLPGVMIEGEFHAVWVDGQGTIHEVSPSAPILGQGISGVLFLPDPKMTDDGSQVDNVRVALVSDPLIDRFIANAESRYQYMNSGGLEGQFGLVVMDPALAVIQDLHEELSNDIVTKYYPG